MAIATALMPPLCTVGYGIANLNWNYAGGALYLFFINCVFIALATFLVVKYLNFPAASKNNSLRRVISYGLLILVVLVPSFFSAYSIVRENRFSNAARHFVKENKTIGGTYIYDYTTDMNTKPYTLTLRLAGESLTTEARAQLYANAENHGIAHNQILFQEDATIEVRRLNETQIVRDWLASTEEQLRQRDDSIRTLRAQLDTYEAQVLPSAQIAEELRAQWPSIREVTLARADSEVILLIVSSLTPEEHKRIENWLSVRLRISKIRVVELHQ